MIIRRSRNAAKSEETPSAKWGLTTPRYCVFLYTRVIQQARINIQADIFYLGVWRSIAELTNLQAAKHYAKLSGDAVGKFDEVVYRFQVQLTMRYPDLDLLPKIEASPWARPLHISDDHLIMALRHDRLAEAFPLISIWPPPMGFSALIRKNTKVHLPPPPGPRPDGTRKLSE